MSSAPLQALHPGDWAKPDLPLYLSSLLRLRGKARGAP